MTTAAIEVANVIKSYNRGKVTALGGVSLSIQPGEVFGLIGPNGAGKTTLMGCLLGLLKPTAGEVSVFGRSAFDLSVRQVTGYLPERPNFDAWMTPWQFLRYHHMLAKRPDSLADTEIKRALERVGLDQNVWHRKILKLSRGTLQRLGLAQALIGKPLICFLDEPDSGMDPMGTALVRGLIGEMKKDGTTVLLNSHHLSEVEKTCDRAALIKKGKIIAIQKLNEDVAAESLMRFQWSASDVEMDMRALLEQCVTEYGVAVKELESNGALVTLPEKQLSSALIKHFVEAGVPLQQATIERQSLEDMFVRLQQET